MLFNNKVHINLLNNFFSTYSQHAIHTVNEIEEQYIGIKAIVAVSEVRKIDVIEKFILKLLALPIDQPKTITFINNTLNLGNVFVQAYVEKLLSYGAIIQADFQYQITEKGIILLETEEIAIEEKEIPYQFIFNPDTSETFSWKKVEELITSNVETPISEQAFLQLVKERANAEYEKLQVKQLEQFYFKAEQAFEIIAYNSSNYRFEKFKLTANSLTLEDANVNIMRTESKIASENVFANTKNQVQPIPVNISFVEHRISQAKKQLDILVKKLSMEKFSLQQVNLFRQMNCPVVIHYEESSTVLDAKTQRVIPQYLQLRSKGKATLHFLQHDIIFDAILLDQNELFYEEDGQWYYHTDLSKWAFVKEFTMELWCDNILCTKDETLWYPLLERVVIDLADEDLLTFMAQAVKEKPINFTHRAQKLLMKHSRQNAALSSLLNQYKFEYYSSKTAQ